MAFQDGGEEAGYFARIVGIGMILTAPLTGPAAPAMIGIGAAAITGAAVGKRIANATVRKRRGYKPGTEERVSSIIAGGVNLLDSAPDAADALKDLLDKDE